MKKLYILTLAAAMLITTSCDDFLATDTPSKQSNTNVFNTEAMAEAALMGVYATMSDTYVYGQKISVNWQNISDTENCNLYLTNYKEVNSDYGQNHYYGNSGNSTTRWNNIFRFAELASAAVEGMRGGELLKTNPTVGKPLLGEALTLRALAYFELVRIYGDIPYKKTTSNSDLSNVYIGKIDRDTVYADLVKNLQEAIEYLPWLGSGKASTAERISKGFAKGLLARVALFAGGWSLRDGNQFPDMQLEKHPTIPEMNGYYVGRVKNYKEYYEIAAKQCAEILGDPENPHQLDPDFENIWKTVNHLDQNPYNENLYEVGLGGELDATNIILPMVCVNTNIGLDHMDYLGDSYESIARAKAGIIKDHVDFITGEHKQECVDIFRDTCEKRHSHLIRLDRIHDLQDGENVKYTYKDYNIVLNTPALYQIENSALALETLLYLKKHHFIELDESSIVEGLFEAKWAGRFEIISEKPLIILDGAHNREGVDELYRSARKLHNLKIIFSALRDKDTDYMIERLLDLTYDITVCEFKHPRSQSAKLLAGDYPVKIEPDFRKALDDIYLQEGTFLITGSLYFISEVRKYLLQKNS